MELKPCPFCGGRAEIDSYETFAWCERTYIVGCGNDNCLVSPSVKGEIKSETIEAWNRRVGEEETT